MSGLPSLTANICQFHKAALPFLSQIPLIAGPILMSIPLYLIKAEIVGTSLMIWEKSSDKVTAYLKQETRLLSTS